MPWYDLQCDACGSKLNDVNLPSDARNSKPCPDCRRPMRVAVAPIAITGPTTDKPWVYGNDMQNGAYIRSNAERRRYEAATGQRMAEPGEWQAKIDNAYKLSLIHI